MQIHANVKCDCGHTQKDHYQSIGYCHHSEHIDAGKCGCTWFNPNVNYIKRHKLKINNMPIKLKTEKRKTYISRNKVRKVIAGVPNKFKCSQKLWLKFKHNGQKIYNDVMEQSLKNQSITVHPNTELTKEEWSTICHNFACYAAWSLADLKLEKGDTVIDIDDNGKETKKRKVA